MKDARQASLAKKTACVVFMLIFILKAANAEAAYSRTLRLGDSGQDVLQLQQTLNLSTDTKISENGPGSPGMETGYFGALTRSAVIRYQNAHVKEILEPAGLNAGNGVVGPYTQVALDSTVISRPAPASAISLPTNAPVAPVVSVAPAPTASVSSNPNMKNVDVFFAALDKAAAKKGISQQIVQKIKAQALKDLATTTNIRKQFSDLVLNKKRLSDAQQASFAGLVQSGISAIEGFFLPNQAEAGGLSLTGLPFGGAVLFPFYCGCSENWIIAIEPLPPTFPELLTYESFSQAYLSFNIPDTEWLLGNYIPVGVGCVEYIPPYECVDIPSDGQISPETGSSPL